MGKADRSAAGSRMQLHAEPDHTLLTLTGEIDISVRLEASPICQAIAERGLPLVIDATEVTFVDSAGMSVLVRLSRDARANGYPAKLRGAPWMLRELLAITGVDQILPIEDDDADGDHQG